MRGRREAQQCQWRGGSLGGHGAPACFARALEDVGVSLVFSSEFFLGGGKVAAKSSKPDTT